MNENQKDKYISQSDICYAILSNICDINRNLQEIDKQFAEASDITHSEVIDDLRAIYQKVSTILDPMKGLEYGLDYFSPTDHEKDTSLNYFYNLMIFGDFCHTFRKHRNHLEKAITSDEIT